jgi:hypothetical protein
MSARVVPANPARMLEGALVDAEQNARIARSPGGNTWASTVYKGDPKPKECATCNKRGVHMQMINAGAIECSHIECPNRKRCTAQASDKAPEVQS